MTSLPQLPPELRLPIILAIAASLAAISFAWWAHRTHQYALTERNLAANRVERLTLRLQRFQAEREGILRRASQFQAWQAQGLIGEAGTGSWNMMLQDLGRASGLTALRHGTSPVTTNETHGDFTVLSTRLQLQLQLRHEQQFLDFLARLHRHGGALVRLQSCRLARLPPAGDEPTALSPHLTAECELDWITVQNKPMATP